MAVAGDSPGRIRADRIYLTTRLLAAAIVPFLLLAVYVLVLRTGQTGRLWAWEIRSPMSAFMLAAAYAAGAYYFTRAAMARCWHHVGLGLLPVTTFASLMGVVTVVHWSRFTHGNVAFTLWAALYFSTPVLVAAAWLSNRREDPGTPDADDVRVPTAYRRASGLLGAVGLVAATVLLVYPSVLIGVWAWPLTPLTARTLCVIFALLDVYLLCLAVESRWSASRLNVESLLVAAMFIAVGIVRAAGTFVWSRPLAWLFTAATVGTLAATAAALLAARRRPT